MAELTGAITVRERALTNLLHAVRSRDLVMAVTASSATVALEELQAGLPDGAMLLEFFIARDQVIVCGISPTTLWIERLPSSIGKIRDLLGAFRFQLNRFNHGPAYLQRYASSLRQSTRDSLCQLYDLLLRPFSECLVCDNLIIVPHGELHNVPFHALCDGQRYLLEQMGVSYAPSATIFHHISTTKNETVARRPLIIGLTDATIPFAQVEAEALAQIFPDSELCIGERATVSSLAANDQRPAFLHVSTHATFRTDNPLFSALKLADGWVSVNDIYAMRASAPLITLSACETGRNMVQTGDELMGLCRGFLGAGAKSLIVSLWPVADDSTAHLMTHFYEALKAGMPAGHALRAAQLVIMQQRDHPYYWAPFMLIGDPWTHLSLLTERHSPDTARSADRYQ